MGRRCGTDRPPRSCWLRQRADRQRGRRDRHPLSLADDETASLLPLRSTLRLVGGERTKLLQALRRFLRDAAEVIDSERGDSGATRESVQAIAQLLAALPTCSEVNALAHQASLAVGYLLTGRPGRPPDAGRRLDADALISTGLVSMLADHAELDLQAVASDLAEYLAGPPTDIWDYAILDGSGELQDAIQVADGWELVTPTADELQSVLPLPSTAVYQPDPPFSPNDYSRLACFGALIPTSSHIEATTWISMSSTLSLQVRPSTCCGSR